MIISQIVKIDDHSYTKTVSDSGYYIERNGVKYIDAIDPLGSQREYTETNIPIQGKSETADGKIAKLQAQTAKNTADIEYLAMMTNNDLEV